VYTKTQWFLTESTPPQGDVNEFSGDAYPYALYIMESFQRQSVPPKHYVSASFTPLHFIGFRHGRDESRT